MGKKGKKKQSYADGEGRIFRSKARRKSSKRSQRNWNKRFINDVKDGIIKEDELDFFED